MLRIATIGTSAITESFISAIDATAGATFVGTLSRAAERAQAFTEAHGGTCFFTKLEDLAASDEVDAVYIGSPNALPHDQALACVRGGVLRPRRAAAGTAAPEHAGDIVLDEQARRPEHERLIGRAAEELARELACRGDALKAAVVRAVHVAIEKIGILAEDREQGARDIDLCGRGLAARHVEREALCADLGDLCFERLDGGVELGVGHLLIDRLHAATFRT